MGDYVRKSSERKRETMGDHKKSTCCGCEGAGIALGLFALGLLIVIATALVLFVAFGGTLISIIVLVIGTILALFVLALICKLVNFCILSQLLCRKIR